MGDLLTHDFPRRDHLLRPWLRQGESVLVWAPTGIGKTMLSLTIALATAGGGSFLGWSAGPPRRVLLVDGEMHAEDLRDRLAMLAGTVAGIDAEAAAGNLAVISRQFQGGDVRFPDIAEREADDREPGQEMVIREAQRIGAELVILDNLSTLAELPDENDAAAMTPVVTLLMRLKAAGIACVLVHHSGKTGGSYRGSSKLATTFEVIIGLRKLEGHTPGDGAAFELHWEKYRGAPSSVVRDAVVRLGGGPGGPQWEREAVPEDDVETLLEAARTGSFASQRAIAQDLGWGERKVSVMKDRAIRQGRITADEWAGLLAGRDVSSDIAKPRF
jgi:KaiC/GvpD/RAD55 family RecA-like ATPase